MRIIRLMSGNWVVKPPLLRLMLSDTAIVVGAVCVDGVMVYEVVVMLGMRTCSFWKSVRFETRMREKSLVVYVPSRIGAVNCGHKRRLRERMLRISRPECLERVSQTAETKRE